MGARSQPMSPQSPQWRCRQGKSGRQNRQQPVFPANNARPKHAEMANLITKLLQRSWLKVGKAPGVRQPMQALSERINDTIEKIATLGKGSVFSPALQGSNGFL